MLELLAAVGVGFVAARLAWLVTRSWFAHPALSRPNYRNRHLPTGVGVLLPLVAVAVEAGRAVLGSLGVGDRPSLTLARLLVVLAAGAFALLGVVDDVVGRAGPKGFRGHVGALFGGQVTTGMGKLLGGALVAVVLVSPASGGGFGRLVADAALVALAANLGNLLDRGPGRVTKAGLGSFVVLAVAAGFPAELSGVAVVVGAAGGLLADDLHEHLMLGDAGANPLGAVLGLGVVLACAPSTRNAVLAVLLVLNLLGEVISFSRVIEAVRPLRAIDQAGRLRR